MNAVVLIPALNPNDELGRTVAGCFDNGLQTVVIVDDGSDDEHQKYFAQAETLGAVVLHHGQNRGKGAAIRTAVAEVVRNYPDAEGVITADADGQHAPADILRVAQALHEHPDALILGSRDLSAANVPARSRFGNRASSCLFFFMTGTRCGDTQTGLRGIPRALFEAALACPGERYDYEMNFLVDLAKKKYPLVTVPIRTIYMDNNSASHFRAVRDSVLIYKQLIKYIVVAVTSFLLDIGLFTLFYHLVGDADRVMWATVSARCLSGGYNFALNKLWSFEAKGRTTTQLVRYIILFLGAMFTSGAVVGALERVGLPVVLAKILTDFVIFILNYVIQRRWVFAPAD